MWVRARDFTKSHGVSGNWKRIWGFTLAYTTGVGGKIGDCAFFSRSRRRRRSSGRINKKKTVVFTRRRRRENIRKQISISAPRRREWIQNEKTVRTRRPSGHYPPVRLPNSVTQPYRIGEIIIAACVRQGLVFRDQVLRYEIVECRLRN